MARSVDEDGAHELLALVAVKVPRTLVEVDVRFVKEAFVADKLPADMALAFTALAVTVPLTPRFLRLLIEKLFQL